MLISKRGWEGYYSLVNERVHVVDRRLSGLWKRVGEKVWDGWEGGWRETKTLKVGLNTCSEVESNCTWPGPCTQDLFQSLESVGSLQFPYARHRIPCSPLSPLLPRTRTLKKLVEADRE